MRCNLTPPPRIQYCREHGSHGASPREVIVSVDSWQDCDSVWDSLSAYVDGEASIEERERVERHIARCGACARDLAFMQQTAESLARTPEVEPPAGLREAILAATIYKPTLRQRLAAALQPILGPTPVRRLSLASGLVAAAVLGIVFTARTPAPIPIVSSAPTRVASGLPVSAPPIARHLRGRESPAHPREAIPHEESQPAGEAPADRAAPRPERSSPRVELAAYRQPPAARPSASGRGTPLAAVLARKSPPPVPTGARTDTAPPITPPIEPMPPAGGLIEDARTPDRMVRTDPSPAPTTNPTSPAPAGDDTVHLRLTANAEPMSPDAVASLADLRRAIHRGNNRLITSAVLVRPRDRRELTVDVYKTQF